MSDPLILRAVLRRVSPMVIRLVSFSDRMILPEMCPRYSCLEQRSGLHHPRSRSGVQQHPAENRSRAVHEFQLHRQEKFLYVRETCISHGRSAATAHADRRMVALDAILNVQDTHLKETSDALLDGCSSHRFAGERSRGPG